MELAFLLFLCIGLLPSVKSYFIKCKFLIHGLQFLTNVMMMMMIGLHSSLTKKIDWIVLGEYHQNQATKMLENQQNIYL